MDIFELMDKQISDLHSKFYSFQLAADTPGIFVKNPSSPSKNPVDVLPERDTITYPSTISQRLAVRGSLEGRFIWRIEHGRKLMGPEKWSDPSPHIEYQHDDAPTLSADPVGIIQCRCESDQRRRSN